jgi:hypothetical protein
MVTATVVTVAAVTKPCRRKFTNASSKKKASKLSQLTAEHSLEFIADDATSGKFNHALSVGVNNRLIVSCHDDSSPLTVDAQEKVNDFKGRSWV